MTLRRKLTPVSKHDLHAAFVGSYPEYVRGRVASMGVSIDELEAAIERGCKWLDNELAALLALEPASQRRSPLELFRMALAFPTQVLEEAGTPAPIRDPAAVAAMPGDTFDMAPASSQALGDAAWKAHMAWGIAKASSVAGVVPGASQDRPVEATVALVSTNLMDRVAISNAVVAAGYSLTVWRNPGAIEDGLSRSLPGFALVDLEHPFAEDALRKFSTVKISVIAFGPHVDDIALVRARALGATEALPRSRFFRRLPKLLPKRS